MAVTAGTISGNKVLVYVGGVAVACTTGGTLNITNNQTETTCKDNDGAVQYIPGSQDWNLQVDGNSKFDVAVGLAEMARLAKTKETAVVRIATGNADDPYFEGSAFVSSFNWTNPVNAASTWAATFSPRSPILLFNT
jgi:predicted secreted protein